MVRNALGSLLALIGATAAVLSPFRSWYDGRRGRDYRLAELFQGQGVSDAPATLLTGLLVAMAVAAALTLLAAALRARSLMALPGVLVLGVTVLWMVRQGQAAGGLVVDSAGNGLGPGVALAAAGGVALLLGTLVMRGRRGRRAFDPEFYPEPEPYAEWPSPGARGPRAPGPPHGYGQPGAGPGRGDGSEGDTVPLPPIRP